MSVEWVRNVLFWCMVLNVVILWTWLLAFVLAHDSMHRVHGRWFHLSREHFDALHYGGMAIYKVGIILFNVVPWIALWIVG